MTPYNILYDLDFTIRKYIGLLNLFLKNGYHLSPVQAETDTNYKKSIILRHDVDKSPENSLQFAVIQSELGIKSTYYFRIIPRYFNPEIIEKIQTLGHQIGYHYEDVNLIYNGLKNKKRISEPCLIEKSYESFLRNLKEVRKIASVNTICMHGNPLSKYDNRLLWKYYNYHDLGIETEPYFDIDLSDRLYLTDTGRNWNAEETSIRDKLCSFNDSFYRGWNTQPCENSAMRINEETFNFQKQFNYKTSNEIVAAVLKGELSPKMMFTFHPQRWSDNYLKWIHELIAQNIKNQIKRFLINTKM